MPQSTLTQKGQTTVPIAIRKALKVGPHARLDWILSDGTAIVRPQGSALSLFGSLKPAKAFPGLAKEKAAVRHAVARQTARQGRKHG